MKKVVAFSFILAILHSILFFGEELGISVMLFVIPTIFCVFNILDEKEMIKNRKAFYLSIPIVLISMTYLFFNNSFFSFWNVIAIFLLFVVMLIVALTEGKPIHRWFSKIISVIFGPLEHIDASTTSIIDNVVKRKDSKDDVSESRKNIRKIALGIIVAIPILLIILILLSSADMIFAKELENVFQVFNQIFEFATITDLIFRIAIIIMLTIYFVAFLQNLIKDEEDKITSNALVEIRFRLDHIVVNTVLTILNIVYLVFCYIQISALFMGYTTLEESEYANYARQGFFQLMTVSLINLSIILISSHIIKDKKVKYMKIMNLLLAIFTIIILISSFMRMYLYEQTFGYTFLRLMVYCILMTEAILMIPTIMYIVKPDLNLIKPYFIIILTMYLIVNYINIDKVIAKRNVDRFMKNPKIENIDLNYLSTLGVDSVPEIMRLLEIKSDSLEEIEIKNRVKEELYHKKESLKKETFQGFNINRYIVHEKLKNIY